MGRHHLPLQAQLIAVLLAAPAWAADKDNGSMPDVVIQAEGSRPVDREKPKLEFPVKYDSPLETDMKADDGVRSRVPSDLNRSAALAPGLAESPVAIGAATNWIVAPWRGEAVRLFFPRKELSSVGASPSKTGKWELVVADSQGKSFTRFGGEGIPPEKLEFDGKSPEGDWLAVGHAYTPVFTYKDPNGRVRTAMGKPFALAGLSLDNPRAVRLSPRALLGKEGSAELTEEGREIIREAAQIVQRQSPGLNLQLGIHLVRNDSSWVRAVGEACAKVLAKELMVRADSITVKTDPGTPDLKERIELVAGGR